MPVEIINLSNMVIDPNGKTIRENNLEINHDIPIGTLVEVTASEDRVPQSEFRKKWHGVRLFVMRQTRDCDGTPLYTLGPNEEEDCPPVFSRMYGGFGRDNLKIVG